MKKKPCRLLIGVPSMNMVHAKFMKAMIELSIFMLRVETPVPWTLEEYVFNNQRSSVLSKKREDLVEIAIEGDFTHLLFIDSDMYFPPNLFHRLLLHNKDCVAINCSVKSIKEPSFTARNLDLQGERFEVITYPPGQNKEPLEKVWRIGTGIMLVTTRALKKIKPPRFPVTWEVDKYVGEDWNFVDKLHKEARIPTYIDHDLSWEISHIGDFEYSPDFVLRSITYQNWVEEEKEKNKKANVG